MEQLLALALLIVEFILLVATIVLLYLSRHELEGRKKLLEKMFEVTRLLSRTLYFNSVLEALRSAKKEVFGSVTGSRPRGQSDFLDKVVEEIRAAVNRGARVRYLLPKGSERLYVGHLYRKAGAEIKYHGGLVVYDLRHMVVDNKIVVLGFPEKVGLEQPTRVGVKIESESLASIFKERFERLWEEAISYEDYLAQKIEDIRRANPNASVELVANQLGLPKEEVEEFWDHGKKHQQALGLLREDD